MSADAGNSSSSADRDFSLGQSSSAPSGNEIFYHNFMWSNSNDENPSDSSGGRDDEHEGGTSKSEDLEVRMDLTDDLLHMVTCLNIFCFYISTVAYFFYLILFLFSP